MLPVEAVARVVDEDVGGDPFFEVEEEGHVEKSAESSALLLFRFTMFRLALPENRGQGRGNK